MKPRGRAVAGSCVMRIALALEPPTVVASTPSALSQDGSSARVSGEGPCEPTVPTACPSPAAVSARSTTANPSSAEASSKNDPRCAGRGTVRLAPEARISVLLRDGGPSYERPTARSSPPGYSASPAGHESWSRPSSRGSRSSASTCVRAARARPALLARTSPCSPRACSAREAAVGLAGCGRSTLRAQLRP